MIFNDPCFLRARDSADQVTTSKARAAVGMRCFQTRNYSELLVMNLENSSCDPTKLVYSFNPSCILHEKVWSLSRTIFFRYVKELELLKKLFYHNRRELEYVFVPTYPGYINWIKTQNHVDNARFLDCTVCICSGRYGAV